MKKVFASVIAIATIITCVLLASCGSNEVKGFTEEQQVSILSEVETACSKYIEQKPIAIFDDDTKDVKVLIEGCAEMPIETIINLWVEIDSIESFRLLRITDGIDEFYAYISYGGENITVRKNDTVYFTYSSMGDINYMPYSMLSKYQKYCIGDYIQRMYDSYDAQDGKYTGDKYTEKIFNAAMTLYGKSYDQINDAWANYNRNKNSLPKGSGLNQTNQVVIIPLLENPETGEFEEDVSTVTAKTLTRGQNYSLEIKEREGYYFQGFYIGDKSVEPITDTEGHSLTPWTSPINQRIYAKYTKAIEHRFLVDNEKYESGKNESVVSVNKPKDPQKNGYRFDGWEVNGSIVSFPFSVESNTDFIAKFTPIEYAITYTEFENDTALDTTFTIEDLPFALPIVTKENALYKGWSESSDGSNVILEITTVGNKVLYPKWDVDTEGLIYGETDIGLFVTNYYGTDTEVIIPTTHGEKTVIGIYANAFENSNITKIVVPNTITTIGDAAFKGCTQLKSIQLPNSITEIGKNAFESCEALVSMHLPTELTILRQSMFSGCYSLKSVTLGDKITVLEYGVFSRCKSIVQIVLPDSIEDLGGGCFLFCEKLVSVKMPANLVEIGSSAFAWCDSLESITIPAKVKVINNNCFENCDNLKSVTFEDTTDWYTTTIWQGSAGSGLKRDVTSPTANAVLFNGVYNCKFYWYKY